jgi:hypothetical protein
MVNGESLLDLTGNPVGAQVFVVLHFDEFRVRAPAPNEEVRRVPARPYLVAKCQSIGWEVIEASG